MKRRDFLKRLGIGSIAVASIPLVLSGEEEKNPYDTPIQDASEYYKELHTKSGWYDKNPYALTEKECYFVEYDEVRYYNNEGELLRIEKNGHPWLQEKHNQNT